MKAKLTESAQIEQCVKKRKEERTDATHQRGAGADAAEEITWSKRSI